MHRVHCFLICMLYHILLEGQSKTFGTSIGHWVCYDIPCLLTTFLSKLFDLKPCNCIFHALSFSLCPLQVRFWYIKNERVATNGLALLNARISDLQRTFGHIAWGRHFLSRDFWSSKTVIPYMKHWLEYFPFPLQNLRKSYYSSLLLFSQKLTYACKGFTGAALRWLSALWILIRPQRYSQY